MLGALHVGGKTVPLIVILLVVFGWGGLQSQRRWRAGGPAWLIVPMLLCYALAALAALWLFAAVSLVLYNATS